MQPPFSEKKWGEIVNKMIKVFRRTDPGSCCNRDHQIPGHRIFQRQIGAVEPPLSLPSLRMSKDFEWKIFYFHALGKTGGYPNFLFFYISRANSVGRVYGQIICQARIECLSAGRREESAWREHSFLHRVSPAAGIRRPYIRS